MSRTTEYGQWNSIKSSWDLWCSPLRPCKDDVELISKAINKRKITSSGLISSLILGSTPELTQLMLDCDNDCFAVDMSRSMLDSVWNGKRCNAICSDWQSMPWIDDCFDLVLCDGGLQLLQFPGKVKTVLNEVDRVLTKKGIFVCRIFAKPHSKEDSCTVLKDLFSGKIGNTSELKLRIWPTLQQSVEQGVILDNVWNYLHKNVGPWDQLAERLGWDLDQLKVLDLYKHNQATMHFCGLEKFTSFVSSVINFSASEILYGTYPGSEQCPIIVFERNTLNR